MFIFWLRLADRINLQYQLRGMQPTAPRGLALATLIVLVVPYIGGIISGLILVPILAGIMQARVNELARLEGR